MILFISKWFSCLILILIKNLFFLLLLIFSFWFPDYQLYFHSFFVSFFVLYLSCLLQFLFFPFLWSVVFVLISRISKNFSNLNKNEFNVFVRLFPFFHFLRRIIIVDFRFSSVGLMIFKDEYYHICVLLTLDLIHNII